MDLSALLQPISELAAYRQLRQALSGKAAPGGALRLLRSVRPPLACLLAADLGRPILLLTSRSDRLLSLAEEFPAWLPNLRLLLFPEPAPLFYELAPWSPRTIQQRSATLSILTASRQPGNTSAPPAETPTIILATAGAAMTRTLGLRHLLTNSIWLRPGSHSRMDRLLNLLVGTGYAHTTVVTSPGEFSRRGGMLDLWPPAEPQPLRVEFLGDEVETIRRFDPASQRSNVLLNQARIFPAREGLPSLYQEAWDRWQPAQPLGEDPSTSRLLEFFLPWMNPSPTGILDLLPAEALVVVDDLASFEEAIGYLEEQAVALRAEYERAGSLPHEFPLPYLTLTELRESLLSRNAVDLGMLSPIEEGEAGIPLADCFSPGSRFGGQLKPLLDYLSRIREAHDVAVVVSRQTPRLVELWGEGTSPDQSMERLPAQFIPGDVYFVHGALAEGWSLHGPGTHTTHLLTDAEVFGWSRPHPRRRPAVTTFAPESPYADLHPGDWVVHVEYGIGRFGGLVERQLEGLTREFLLIEYAEGDQLYVPIHQADRITSYVGVSGQPPSPSRLGTQEWQRAKVQAQSAIEEVARSLLELYARRSMVSGHTFQPDTDWQLDLEASFPYVQTEDQAKAVAAVKQDMERSRPMDRLICGDAGYGKTEVALRAAFKAVMDGKQVAILVPTTVLAQQHYNTFRQRLAAFPVTVEMLSRFRSRGEAGEVVRLLAQGKVDIVIGTHRLLQEDVRFKDLGLLIIDEEQRFGVTHKEFFKRMRTEVDVLTLTATPIPRTLYMALTGLRDISTINTPPEERQPAVTHIGLYEPRLIRQAVLRELDRGGQVFFVHNRVQTIATMCRRLGRLVPEARLAMAHGQMPERDLAQVMERFNAGEVDLLVSTSIIESGLDIPNANTLIVDRADTFGLAQLYQLRGRVGRGASRAYAYFFRHPHHHTDEEALQRLEFLAEHTQLGAGYSIAMRDLEMRGAGEILGTRQHGHIAAIGFHLYTRLLTSAVRRMRAGGETAASVLPVPSLGGIEPLMVSVDLPLASSIPADYVPERDLRLQLYRRMAELRAEGALNALSEELIDRFGPLPAQTENLIYQLRAKLMAAQAGVEAITHENGQILLQLPMAEETAAELELGDNIRLSKRGIWLTSRKGSEWRSRLTETLAALAARGPAPNNI